MLWLIAFIAFKNQQMMLSTPFLIDNESVLNQVFFTKPIGSVHNLSQPDLNPIATSQKLLKESPITINVIHTYSHQEKTKIR